ncbi:hypothetical protein GYMLUDRAFT_74926 [Collybiopsis luxurians FD-317 M1]|uniref:DUF6534 domain-containing protein n=1 Tax=Collybiopsis luxurians FD-317 M1 TaxID=944289 RepID=A0A0D0CRX6_9AGAR|nr:hypothetical protein GYMLUDRAFT_74926 [Collybiopsis luxurians FD-317 M1]
MMNSNKHVYAIQLKCSPTLVLDSAFFAIGPTYGALYWSAILCTGFWAITCIQAALDTVHNAMISAGVYVYLVTNFGDFESFFTIIPEVLASAFIQGFFVWRIFQLTRARPIKWLPVAIWVPFALLQIGISIYLIKGLQTPTILTLTSRPIYIISIIYLVTASAVDLTLSLVITLILYRRSSVTRFSSTSSMLKKLILISINNGLWTAIFALLDLILYVIYPTMSLYLIFDYMMCSLYTNTLLANLNARDWMGSTEVSVSSKFIPSRSLQSHDDV